MRIHIFLLFLSTGFPIFSFAQNKNSSVDVRHYNFKLQLNDENNEIKGEATATVLFIKHTDQISFDLISKNNDGGGMSVLSVKENGETARFNHTGGQLQILLTKQANAGETRIYTVLYNGIPADGLVFSNNKYKQRTIFADNWPNRARHWLPCIDHLSDKASVDFMVTAPAHYKVISNGILIEETSLENNLKFTHWQETVPLPTKVMVIGLADFAVNYAGDVDCIPVSSWVFPQDKKKAFYDYAQALDILPFFIKYVGPYAYKKLANV